MSEKYKINRTFNARRTIKDSTVNLTYNVKEVDSVAEFSLGVSISAGGGGLPFKPYPKKENAEEVWQEIKEYSAELFTLLKLHYAKLSNRMAIDVLWNVQLAPISGVDFLFEPKSFNFDLYDYKNKIAFGLYKEDASNPKLFPNLIEDFQQRFENLHQNRKQLTLAKRYSQKIADLRRVSSVVLLENLADLETSSMSDTVALNLILSDNIESLHKVLYERQELLLSEWMKQFHEDFPDTDLHLLFQD